MGLSKLFKRKHGPVVHSGPLTLLNSNSLSSTARNATPNTDAIEPPPQDTVAATSDIDDLRNDLWRKAYQKLKGDQPELSKAYESLAKEQIGMAQSSDFGPNTIRLVVTTQQERMESKQWKYTWFGKERAVRDTVETICGVVQQASGLISAGMTAAPPYVSLPWSMVSILIPFLANDVQAVQSAVTGLHDVTSVMASYNYAEREFLPIDETRDDFQIAVLDLYVSILEYQATAALYFAKSTLKRFGMNLLPKHSWKDSLSKMKELDMGCRVQLDALGVRLSQRGFSNITSLLDQGKIMLQRIEEAIASKRAYRERIQLWISPANPYDDHDRVKQRLGDDYLGSGTWLLTDQTIFAPWKTSSSGTVLLRGIMGSGKSSLISIVIESIQRSSDGLLAFVYCSANGDASSSRSDTLTILRCLLSQVAILPDGSVSPSVRAAYDKVDSQAGRGFIPTLRGIQALFKTIFEESADEQMTFIFDALDECIDYDGLLQQLQELRKLHPKIRWFFSARMGVQIDAHFPDHMQVHIDQGNGSDIETYVEMEVTKRYAAVGMNDTQAERLKKALVRLAEGMFRWVELEISIYLPPPSSQGRKLRSKDIDNRLTKLESSQAKIDDRLMDAYFVLYSRALGSEDEEARREAVSSAIKWVLCALRPLLSAELLRAVTVQADGTYDDDLTEDMLLDYCSNLLIQDARGLVRLAHLSVRQFFEEKVPEEFGLEHQHGQAALSSLWALDIFRSHQWRHKFRLLNSSLVHYCNPILNVSGDAERTFVLYCRSSWTSHYILAHRHARLNAALGGLADKLSIPFTGYLSWTASTTSFRAEACPSATTISKHNVAPDLCTAVDIRSKRWTSKEPCLPGMEELIPPFLDPSLTKWRRNVTFEGNSFDLWPNKPLYVVGMNGIRADGSIGFSCLMPEELDMSDADFYGNTPLHYAAYYNQTKIVSSLLQAGARINAQNLKGDTPLHVAALASASESFLELLGAGASPTLRNAAGHTAVQSVRPPSLADYLLQQYAKQSHDTQELANRPRPVVDVVSGVQCSVCDLSNWIESSRLGEKHTVMAFTLGRSARKSGCILCQAVAKRLKIDFAMDAAADSGLHDEFDWPVSIQVKLDTDSRFKTGKDWLVYTSREDVVELELCVEMDRKDNINALSAISDTFKGRAIRQDPCGSLRGWLESCKSHIECRKAVQSSVLPERLIYLWSGDAGHDVRICLSSDFEGKPPAYVWFAWIWGQRHDFPQLKKANMENMRECIPFKQLPRLWKEAIDLCRECGYRYLFIDALCIIQDDPDDRQRDPAVLGGCISNADLVLACSQQSDPTKQLLPWYGLDPVSQSWQAHLRGDERVSFRLRVRQPLAEVGMLMRAHVLTRAWRQQETLLPRRFVIFGDEQLYWGCGAGIASEGETAMTSAPWVTIPTIKRLYSERSLYQGDHAMRHFAYRHWYDLVEINSRGRLTFAPDRLPSMTAMAMEFSRLLGGPHLVSGLWDEDLRTGLLWMATLDHREYASQIESGQDLSPTWSWATAGCPVSYGLIPGLQYASEHDISRSHLEIDRYDEKQLNFNCLSLEASSLNDTIFADFECFVDLPRPDDRKRSFWTSSDTYFVIVAPWVFNPSGQSRWVGLMIAKHLDSDVYVREGVFLGPRCDSDLVHWEKRSFALI